MTTVPRLNPYVGPRAFTTGERLYGRDRELRELLNLLIAERIVLFYSPSGAGKTSLIQAALIPALEREQFAVFPVLRIGLAPPPAVAAGAPGQNRYILSLLLALEEGVSPEQQMPLPELAAMDLPTYLQQRLAGEGRSGEAVLIFDQFEEIITTDPMNRPAKQAFFDQVGEALRDRRLWALFALREEYLAPLDPYRPRVPTRFSTTFRLDLLGATAARLAIQQPAQAVGVAFSDAAAEQLVNDLRRVRVQQPDGSSEEQLGDYVEPVQLQVVCRRLWDQLAPTATQIGETEVGGAGAVDNVDKALADYYAEQVAAIATETGVDERRIRDWCETQLIMGSGIRGQVLQEHGQSGGLDNRAIRLLVDAHVVRAEERRGSTWFELAHDRLLGPIQQDNARWREIHLSVLQRQAALWVREQRPNGLLIRDRALVEAERWAATHRPELLPIEQEFLDTARTARRARRIRATIAAGVVSVLTIAFLFVLYFYLQAEEQARRATSRQLAAQALTHLNDQPDLSLLLGVAAYRTTDTFEARNSLLTAIQQHPYVAAFLHGHKYEIHSLAFSPDGRTLVSGGCATKNIIQECIEGELRFWDVATRRALGPAQVVYPNAITNLSFSPDGSTLATSSVSSTIILWDVATQKPRDPPLDVGPTRAATGLFSPDGKILVTGSAESIRLWDATTRPLQPLAVLPGQPQQDIPILAFRPDGKILAASDGTVIHLWDVQAVTLTLTLPGTNGTVSKLAFSPDGNMLAAIGLPGPLSGILTLWDLALAKPRDLSAGNGEIDQNVVNVAFSPDGKTAISTRRDGTIIVWDVASGRPLDKPLTGHTASVLAVAFSSDGRTLASAGADATVILWDVTTPNPLVQALSGLDQTSNVTYSRDGTMLATRGADSILLWDTRSGKPRGDPLAAEQVGLPSLALAPDGKTLAAGIGNGTTGGQVVLWDTNSGQRRDPPLDEQPYEVLAIAFSPDSQTLAIASRLSPPAAPAETRVRLWDIASHQPGGPTFRDPSGPGQAMADVYSLAFSPSGKTLIAGMCVNQSVGRCNTGQVVAWDVATGQIQDPPFTDFNSWVYSVAFSPDGRLAAAGSASEARVWDATTHLLAKRPFLIQGRDITSLAFTPDGAALVTGSEDGIILWDLVAQQELGRLAADPRYPSLVGGVDSVAVSADGKTVAAGHRTGPVTLWNVDPETWMQQACLIANRNLSQVEWEQYLPGQVYRQLCPALPTGDSTTPDSSPAKR